MESSEEMFENHFHFLSSRKNWDISKTQDIKITNCGHPQMYCVYILQNKYTPSEFIVDIIKKLFHKNNCDAIKIALDISREEKVLCETYTRDAAETKVMHVLEFAQGQQQEVKCIMQKSGSHAIKKS